MPKFDTGQFAVLGEKTSVKIGFVIAIVGLSIGAAYNVATWKSQVEGRIGDRWTGTDMHYWCIQTEALNSGFTCGTVRRPSREEIR